MTATCSLTYTAPLVRLDLHVVRDRMSVHRASDLPRRELYGYIFHLGRLLREVRAGGLPRVVGRKAAPLLALDLDLRKKCIYY